MSRKTSISWVSFTLSDIPPGLIQKLSHIPASVLAGYRSGKFKMSSKSASRLRSVYERVQYKRLRDAGANIKDAKNQKRRAPQIVLSTAKKLLQVSKKISKKSEIPHASILKWMKGYTDRTPQLWEYYVKEKKWEPLEKYREKHPRIRKSKRKALPRKPAKSLKPILKVKKRSRKK